MPRYRPIDDNWMFIRPRSQRDNEWKVAMLGYRGVKSQSLLDLHLIASKPSRMGSYSDAHVTFVLSGNEKQHIYYQVNGDRLVADYVLAPHGWRSSYWVHYPDLQATSERELLHLVQYCRSEETLDQVPRAND